MQSWASETLLAVEVSSKNVKPLSVPADTHKGLKSVTLLCLLFPTLVIIHFQKYHIWDEKKR